MQTRPSPPESRIDTVVDEMHGHRVEDPYRWLEDGDSPQTAEWTRQQNAYTESVLGALPGRAELGARLAELLNVGPVSAPVTRGGRYFYQRREGGQNQPVLFVRDGINGNDRVLLDPNSASAEGTVSLDWWYPSLDGSLLAYGYSSNGSEWSTLRVRAVENGEDLSDEIPRTRYASVAWLPDNSGLYYTRFPAPGDVPEGDENYNQTIYLHRLGEDPARDQRVLPREIGKEELPGISISRDGRYLMANISPDFYSSDIYILDLSHPESEWITVIEGQKAEFHGTFAGGTLLLRTNLDAPNFRLFAVDPGQPEQQHWQEIIPERADAVLEDVTPWDSKLLVLYLRNAVSQLSIHDAGGKRLNNVELPGLGTVTSVTGGWQETNAFYTFESFATPTMVYRLEAAQAPTVWTRVEAPVEPEDYLVQQEWYTSRDGTRVSMFIVHRRDLDRSRPHPTYLTGYGGFNISRTPLFVRDAYVWLERDGIYALPNLRGGGEYGEEWHGAGMLERKQNVFDDFIAAAEYLIAEDYTSPELLAISGRSNGGLLVGAALVQRPDLFRAVVCGVPLLDMLRYQQFLIARWWIPEYGSAENPEQFPFLYEYSPYHHVREGEKYPAVLFITAESDSRVEPLHARKMAARLQAANASDRPILIRIESRAGHGQGKPVAKLIEDQTDMWAFLFWQVGGGDGSWH